MAEEDTSKKNKGSIILVDDDPLIIRMYQKKLSSDGYSVQTAVNGEEAINLVMKKKPDIMLLDVMMPTMNGVETLKALKAKPETSDIPVIFLTNLGDSKEDMQKAKDLGALDYLVKADVELSELSERVEKAITAAANIKKHFREGDTN